MSDRALDRVPPAMLSLAAPLSRFHCDEAGNDAFLHDTAERLRHDFAIHHTTIQVEREGLFGVCHINAREHGCCWPKQATAAPDAHSPISPTTGTGDVP